MDRRLNNIFIVEKGKGLNYTPPSGRSGIKKYPPRDSRILHGEQVKRQFEIAWKEAKSCEDRLAVSASTRDGVYLQVKGKAGYDLLTKSLEDTRQGIRLRNVQTDETGTLCATVFIPNKKQDYFIKKINKYKEKDSGTDVIGTIESINVAMVEALWIGCRESIPKQTPEWCEVWITYEMNEQIEEVKAEFFSLCKLINIQAKEQCIVFPERMIFGAHLNHDKLALLLSQSSRIAEYRKMPTPTSFFTKLSNAEQREWSLDLSSRIYVEDDLNTSICLLDTGINNGHPILAPLIKDSDKHTIDITKGTDDKVGHGTNMAGIAAFFRLEDKLETMAVVDVYHFIETVKMMDKSNDNPEELYGDLTAEAISLAEIENPEVNRVICMAITADTDINQDGRPSSWSGAIDSIVSGADEEDTHRLVLVSAGNTSVSEIIDTKDYKSAVINHSIENPGQAWNAITVGAYTELIQLEDPLYKDFSALADQGNFSPYTSTSVYWDHKKWPIKPEIMLEGGNLAYSEKDDFYSEAADLSLLTTNHQYLSGNPFDVISMTSSATAQASWLAANIWNKYPELWPETVRALMIHSADWTPQMKKSINKSGKLSKSDYRKLLRICGYGVPTIEKAMWSAANSVNLIIQDELQPYIKKENGSIAANEMHIHTLPWPKSLLEDNEGADVKMRVTLSYYIEPGPGEIGWKDKYRYPSCGLSFDVNNPMEDSENFMKRISKAMRDDEDDNGEIKNDSARWTLGVNNRNVGSIHSDIWEGTASQLAESNMIAIYPKTGWWKTRQYLKRYDSKVRYSLVVSIETPKNEIDLYTAIQTEIKNKLLVKTEITAL
jgi:hypothetical protein